ncbi:serine hydroxymethyltransferase [symbiont of Argiope bruennichi]
MKEQTKKLEKLVDLEKKRQFSTINLIASENFCSEEICKLTGSCLTNKYAEGYPNKRYYGGCEYIDEIETMAIELAKKLFNAEYANVQPHSGSQANEVIYFAFLEKNDTILAMDLNSGGHLSHGYKLNISGKNYNFIHYHVNKETYLLDYDEILNLALKHKPKIILAGASAYSRAIDFSKFREICDKVGAYLHIDMAHISGLVCTNNHPHIFPYADFVTTTTHKTLRGPRSGLILAKEKYKKSINRSLFPGIQGGPLEHVIAAKAQCFIEALDPKFKNYIDQVILNAKAVAKRFLELNYYVLTNGTDNHIINIDILKSKNITGLKAQTILEKTGIILNKNVIPFESLSANETSGIRIGTPFMTTMGWKEKDFIKAVNLIDKILSCEPNEEQINNFKKEVKKLLSNKK